MLTLVYVTCLIYSQGGFLMYTVFHRNYAWCSCKFSQVFQFWPEIFLAWPPASNIKPELHWLHHDTLIGLKVLIFAFFNYIQFLNYFPFFQLFSIFQLFPIFSIISHFSIISPKSKLSYNLSHTADAPLVQKFSVF